MRKAVEAFIEGVSEAELIPFLQEAGYLHLLKSPDEVEDPKSDIQRKCAQVVLLSNNREASTENVEILLYLRDILLSLRSYKGGEILRIPRPPADQSGLLYLLVGELQQFAAQPDVCLKYEEYFALIRSRVELAIGSFFDTFTS